MHGGETAGVRWGNSCSRTSEKQKLCVSGGESPKPEAPMLLVSVPLRHGQDASVAWWYEWLVSLSIRPSLEDLQDSVGATLHLCLPNGNSINFPTL